MNLNETNPTYTSPAESSSREAYALKSFLTIENDSTFDESPTESLKTSIWRQSRQNKTNMYTSMALLIDKKLRKAMAKNA